VTRPTPRSGRARHAFGLLAGTAFALLLLVGTGTAAEAASTRAAGAAPVASTPRAALSRAPMAAPAEPRGPAGPTAPSAPAVPAGSGASTATNGQVSVSVPGQPSQVVTIILLVTLLGVAPSVLLLCTAFTKIVVVLSLVRSAIGTQSVPPNQVLVGLALFLTLFVMGPTFDAMQADGVKPYLDGTKTSAEAFTDGVKPLRAFMLKHTRAEEIALMTKAAGEAAPATPDDVDLRTLIPAFVLSELRAAFIIGFVVFVPFLVVDIVVSAVLMSLGMVMLPPSLISLPFKLLLFVLVDGWSLVVTTLLGSYR
jgi:flagellar biosynthetic protein FliP